MFAFFLRDRSSRREFCEVATAAASLIPNPLPGAPQFFPSVLSLLLPHSNVLDHFTGDFLSLAQDLQSVVIPGGPLDPNSILAEKLANAYGPLLSNAQAISAILIKGGNLDWLKSSLTRLADPNLNQEAVKRLIKDIEEDFGGDAFNLLQLPLFGPSSNLLNPNAIVQVTLTQVAETLAAQNSGICVEQVMKQVQRRTAQSQSEQVTEPSKDLSLSYQRRRDLVDQLAAKQPDPKPHGWDQYLTLPQRLSS